MFYSVDILKTSPCETASQTDLRDCAKELTEQPGYVEIFVTKTR